MRGNHLSGHFSRMSISEASLPLERFVAALAKVGGRYGSASELSNAGFEIAKKEKFRHPVPRRIL